MSDAKQIVEDLFVKYYDIVYDPVELDTTYVFHRRDYIPLAQWVVSQGINKDFAHIQEVFQLIDWNRMPPIYAAATLRYTACVRTHFKEEWDNARQIVYNRFEDWNPVLGRDLMIGL